MRELFTCEPHGFRWAEGDNPCPKCAADARYVNFARPEPRTKSGRIWPLSAYERRAVLRDPASRV